MTDLRTAAQQALEALEWSWGGEPLGTKERDAITALRAALAEAGCAHCRHPLYAGIRCSSCGRWSEVAE